MAHHKVVIIGPGLAGLALSIQLAEAGIDVALIDKITFPKHKVCGEYLSKESVPYLKRLGINWQAYNIPEISRLQIHSQSKLLEVLQLPLGAIGISRYLLDDLLYQRAKQIGVNFYLDTKVQHVYFKDKEYLITTNKELITAKHLVAASGKLSIQGLHQQRPTAENYIGIKYHLQNNTAQNLIQLFTFPNGYGGMSAVEQGKICFAYLVKASEYKKYNSIETFEESFCQSNPELYNILANSKKIWDQPLVISNVYFGKKATFDEQQILYIGDAAGAIPPLAGNGMSMALRSAAHLSKLLLAYFKNEEINKWSTVLHTYDQIWNKEFAERIRTGIVLQNLLFKPFLANWAFSFLKALPFLKKILIKRTHGNPF
jgi:menaquinone-9 beta-reductase